MNKKLTSALLATGLLFGGVGAASAYDGSGASADAGTETQAEVQSTNNQGQIITVQDPGTDSAPDADRDQPEGERPEGRNGHRRGCNLQVAAAIIGIDADELRAALDDGSTVAEVAEANGVDPDEVVDAMVQAAEDRLDAKVGAGRLTEEEADEKLAERADRIEDRVNGVTEDGDTEGG